MNKVIKGLIFTPLLFCNYSAPSEDFLEDDNDYFISSIAKKIGSFSLNTAKAAQKKEIADIVTTTGLTLSAFHYLDLIWTAENYAASYATNDCREQFGGCYDSEDREKYDKANLGDYCEDIERGLRPNSCNSRPDLTPDGCSDFGISQGWATYFNNSCNSHDNCYVTLDANRGACDFEFLTNMETQCHNSRPDGVSYDYCMSTARTFYSTVDSVGFPLFHLAQQDAACDAWMNEVDSCN